VCPHNSLGVSSTMLDALLRSRFTAWVSPRRAFGQLSEEATNANGFHCHFAILVQAPVWLHKRNLPPNLALLGHEADRVTGVLAQIASPVRQELAIGQYPHRQQSENYLGL